LNQWITGWSPTDDEPRDPKAREDFAAWFEEERRSWEETCHFDHYYYEDLRDIGEVDAKEQGFTRLDYVEPSLAFREMFVEPLKDAFWDAWATKHNLFQWWERKIKR
jgi:hypothetical protein